ncbi:general odorant-binding protein 57c-like [Musca autumnalis]|uniref:general odorant-binding protein 57c-like n=1 Tax=Musca autumnalis TaxID=221902 RepID=UPI003CF28668
MNLLNIVFAGIAVITLFALETSADDDAEQHAKCLQQTEISEDEFDTMRDEALIDNSIEVDTRFKCYTHCMLDSWGHLDENGKLNLEALEKDDAMNESDVEAAKKCKEELDNITDKCDYAFEVTTCVIDEVEYQD